MSTSAEHFDAVVVGSGFGGSVTAYRLTEAGHSVCLLERGKAFPPNSFPRSPLGMKSQFWDPSAGLHGMFNLWAFENIDAICASGLGGGSLIYANVLLRKDEEWFVREEAGKGSWKDGYEYWPVTRADLDPHYDRVEQMMNVQKYPLDQPPYDATLKTLAYRDAARNLGLDWDLVNLAVTFANDGEPPRVGEPIREDRPNIHGATRLTCKLTGECDLGCNHGSKNTLDYTYITAAWHAGAEVRTRHEVRSFAPREGGGYRIDYVVHDPEAEGHETDTKALPRHTVTCDRLILSAGTLGTTFLLLRNRAAFPMISRALGTRFGGNGDLLTFARQCRTDGPDGTRVVNVMDSAHAPVITSAIRVPDALDGGEGRGFYLEDAGQPEFVSWMLQLVDAPRAAKSLLPKLPKLASDFIRQRDTDVGEEIASFIGDCAESAGFLPLLGMGRDVPEGTMSLRNGGLAVDWKKDGSSKAYFDRVRGVSKAVAEELGGVFLDNPIWWLSRVVTVHALGGAPMGRDDREGVVDPWGRVYNYPGLHIADGSVMPGPVGPNPSLTIAGLADRFADAILEDMKGAAVTAPPPPPPASEDGGAAAAGAAAQPPPASENPASLEFTEKMRGFITFGEADFDKGYRKGKKSKTKCMFHLTITMDDIERFVADPNRQGSAEGYVDCDALGGKLPVSKGWFNLFVDGDPDDDGKERKLMKYRLLLQDGAGHPITLNGYKEVKDDPGFDLWDDTTTLFTHILAGHVEPDQPDSEVVATGILKVLPADFAVQLTTFRVDPAHRVDALARFSKLFAGNLWDTFGPVAKLKGKKERKGSD
ncbi:MAG: GMC family oxidoreductase [Solirubrobacteraceae bacterium]|nr:GMC family oxidoreductase [Solirubrobacteraceae bacterium]